MATAKKRPSKRKAPLKKAATKRKKRPAKRSQLLDAEKLALGARVKAKRIERGMSVKQLAAGICYWNHVYLIEKGKYAPNTPTLTKLAERLGVSVEWLLSDVTGALQ
jgi:ribosome-binding protein aMBF1 (putative translation factor)